MNDFGRSSKNSSPSTPASPPPRRKSTPDSDEMAARTTSTESMLSFDESSSKPMDSLSTQSLVGGPSRLKRMSVTMPIVEVNPRLFELLTGKSHTDEPLPPNNEATLEWGEHSVRGTIVYNPDTDSYDIPDAVLTCGPHDLDGNHI